jgi:hypothetical protein
MRRLMAAGLLWFSMAAMADVCPKKGETVQTIAYTKSFQCEVGSVLVEGEENPQKYQSCLGDVPAAKEEVWLKRKGSPAELLPSVRSLFSQDDFLVQHKIWVATSVTCDGPSTIRIEYWGGGNCDRCEKSIKYEFDEQGKLKDARIN